MLFIRHAKRAATAFALLTLACLPALAAPPASERTADALMRVEHAWLAALQQRDVAALSRILGREFIDNDFQGRSVTRAQYLGFFARPLAKPAAPPVQEFADTDVRFVADGEVAIVTGVVISKVISKPGAGVDAQTIRHSRFTDVFVWRDGRWQAVTAQETRFTPAARQ